MQPYFIPMHELTIILISNAYPQISIGMYRNQLQLQQGTLFNFDFRKL